MLFSADILSIGPQRLPDRFQRSLTIVGPCRAARDPRMSRVCCPLSHFLSDCSLAASTLQCVISSQTNEPAKSANSVVWSDPKKRKPGKDGRVTPVGDTVDMKTATYTNSIGAPELRTVWRDPDFKPQQRAFYYARVLEIPTPRWTLFDAVRFKVAPAKDAKLIEQERGYTSPIWYSPS